MKVVAKLATELLTARTPPSSQLCSLFQVKYSGACRKASVDVGILHVSMRAASYCIWGRTNKRI